MSSCGKERELTAMGPGSSVGSLPDRDRECQGGSSIA